MYKILDKKLSLVATRDNFLSCLFEFKGNYIFIQKNGITQGNLYLGEML